MTEALTTRLIRTLMGGDAAGHWKYVGMTGRGSAYVVEIDGHRREYDAAGMWSWSQGWALAGDTPADQARPGDDHPEIRAVLVDPSLSDAIRLAIRAAMETDDVGVVELESRSGRTRHAITDALRYGRPQSLSTTMADGLMRALGRGWAVTSTSPADTGAGARLVGLAGAAPEPSGIARARALLICHDRGLVEWTGPSDPNRAQRAATFHVRRAGQDYELAAAHVLPWLTGLADRADSEAAELLTP